MTVADVDRIAWSISRTDCVVRKAAMPRRKHKELRCSLCEILVIEGSDDDNGLSDERYKGGPICNDCAKHDVKPNPRRRPRQRAVRICYRIGAPDEDELEVETAEERTKRSYAEHRQMEYKYCTIPGCGKLLGHSNTSGLCRSHAMIQRRAREREVKQVSGESS